MEADNTSALRTVDGEVCTCLHRPVRGVDRERGAYTAFVGNIPRVTQA